MFFPVSTLKKAFHPPFLSEIPDPPEKLYIRGKLPPEDMYYLAVVGSRNYTDYGKQVLETLIGGLRGHNICIVSGLALGIDALAHNAALQNGLHTVSVPGSGIDDSVLYPRSNRSLAQKILESGGALLSEFEPTFKATHWSFPRRNRIMAGMAHGVLLIEAEEKSGTLITARLAADYNRELMVVPGNIFSNNTKGAHQFLKLGATPVTCAEDILDALGCPRDTDIKPDTIHRTDLPENEQKVLSLLTEPCDRDTLIRALALNAQEANTLLMKMEIDGTIVNDLNTIRRAYS